MAYRDKGSGGDNQNGDQVVEFTAIRAQCGAHSGAARSTLGRHASRTPCAQMKRISPQFLQGSLAHVYVLDSISTGLARIRLAGSYLTDLMGKEVRGLPASKFSNQPRARSCRTPSSLILMIHQSWG
ncbi:PAS domain-containing protein [uncultured Boseongicola sp.]|uniref:PAS domain-containing protein n=1 Tax=uncultured Boseongicola sp. TaxID=1648499 RepID=UPI00341C1B02